jgi:RimJ/RimL family protein N-acetyltransferase
MVQSELDEDGRLAALLDAVIADGWPCEFWDRPAMEWMLSAISSGKASGGWGMWYFVLEPPHVPKRTLIGNGGFKGPPDENGCVEIGYSVVPEHRRFGLATEACRALMSWSLCDPRVQIIAAETYPHLAPSLGVMRKLGMRHIGAGSEPGVVRYGVRRDQIMS